MTVSFLIFPVEEGVYDIKIKYIKESFRIMCSLGHTGVMFI